MFVFKIFDVQKITITLTLIVPKYSATLFMQDPPLISCHRGHYGTNQKANDQVLQKNKL